MGWWPGCNAAGAHPHNTGFANALAVEHGIAAAAGGGLPGVKLFVALHVKLLRSRMGHGMGNRKTRVGWAKRGRSHSGAQTDQVMGGLLGAPPAQPSPPTAGWRAVTIHT